MLYRPAQIKSMRMRYCPAGVWDGSLNMNCNGHRDIIVSNNSIHPRSPISVVLVHGSTYAVG